MEDPDNQQQAPLISNRDHGDDYEDGLDHVTIGPAASPAAGKARTPGLFMWLLTFSAGIGGLLFGCTNNNCYPTVSRQPIRVGPANNKGTQQMTRA